MFEFDESTVINGCLICFSLILRVSFERDWLRKDLNVIGFGLIGWLAPSSVPAIGGKSLTGLFFESIGTELAHFPTPPPLTSQFW
jgi:photosystem I subunit PsaO